MTTICALAWRIIVIIVIVMIMINMMHITIRLIPIKKHVNNPCMKLESRGGCLKSLGQTLQRWTEPGVEKCSSAPSLFDEG